MVTLEEGQFLVKLARETINEFLIKQKRIDPPNNTPLALFDKSGVFCTLNINDRLRGCIGHPYPDLSLVEAVIDSSISAATRDPRFPKVKSKEMENITIDVTVLTPPKLVEVEHPKEYLEKIEVGKHGLVAERGFRKGLLLPQVPLDWGWDVEEFLANTCNKAGLSLMAWTEKETKIYSFEGQVFEEKEPNGEIIERPLEKKKC